MFMDLMLKGKKALVTASSEGMGRAIAEGLADEGVNLILCARREEILDNTVKEIKERYGVNVLGVPADISCKSDLDNVQEASVQWGGVDILVNNAGGPKLGGFFEKEEEEWRSNMELHFYSALRLSKFVIPNMIKNKWGRIINVVSRTVKEPRVDNILSGAVRLPILGMCKSLAAEIGNHNITINSVCPGPFATNRLIDVCRKKAEDEGTSIEQQLKIFAQGVVLGRIGKPEEIGAVVTFLASERSSFITGQLIMVDGGSVKTLF